MSFLAYAAWYQSPLLFLWEKGVFFMENGEFPHFQIYQLFSSLSNNHFLMHFSTSIENTILVSLKLISLEARETWLADLHTHSALIFDFISGSKDFTIQEYF